MQTIIVKVFLGFLLLESGSIITSASPITVAPDRQINLGTYHESIEPNGHMGSVNQQLFRVAFLEILPAT
ncbi:hypothetical protein KEM48_002371 [Puccinia striiformis f. sp. tritici PST-130]|uniref:Uncharacterized protein n=1 Tax=Puccinia striiformis f. sp. tritici PST-78 TaxID=1165861 RepID=A0A0L0VG16_9BASI|nr:hypothetical protein KEM48_002371 [Puccinia striiformis f. sp. tritici PST-130]KNE98198.1 hypothetical protein PSTG_08466 [Puccinia striiformis f. sp. tritici PST-78]